MPSGDFTAVTASEYASGARSSKPSAFIAALTAAACFWWRFITSSMPSFLMIFSASFSPIIRFTAGVYGVSFLSMNFLYALKLK